MTDPLDADDLRDEVAAQPFYRAGPLDLDAIEKEHRPYTTNEIATECATCGDVRWPCKYVLLVARVRELETAMEWFGLDVKKSVAVWKREA